MRSLLALPILGVVLLSGCSSIDAGTITNKNHTPAWTQFITTETCELVGKVDVCTPHLYPIFHPDSWEFDLKDGKNTGWVDVTETTFNDHKVGDYYGAKG